LAKLKAQLEEQQKQIEQLSAMLSAQKKMLDRLSTTGSVAPSHMLPNLGEVASTTPMLPPAPPAPAPRVLDPQVPVGDATSPLQLKIGDATLQPIGFMDFTMSFKT
jgi:hypothetical protein